MKKSPLSLKIRQKLAWEKFKKKHGLKVQLEAKVRSKENYLRNKEKRASEFKEKYKTKEFRDKKLFERKRYMHKWKNAIYELLGNKCNKCGFDDKRAFQIDHINADGYIDNKKRNVTHYRKVAISVQNGEGRYQLLCANCNWIKRIENNENFFHKELKRDVH